MYHANAREFVVMVNRNCFISGLSSLVVVVLIVVVVVAVAKVKVVFVPN
jgi:hypothetical protein